MRLFALGKDVRIGKADYIFEDMDKFDAILPYLKPKIVGEWHIALVDANVGRVKQYIKSDAIPKWLNVSVYLDKKLVEQLVLEFPGLEVRDLNPWERYINLIKEFNVPMEDKAMREIYYRAGPSTQNLAETLEEFRNLDFIRMSDVNKRLPPVKRVYAKNVLLSYLRNKPYAWKLYCSLEEELGLKIAFYAMRKYMRKLFFEKTKYLLNKHVTDKAVLDVDVYRIIHAYYLFESAVAYKQLPAILSSIERRTP
jgi:hypothetical protein